MNKAKLFYFIFYAAMAALSPFLTLYYQSLGLSGTQIGLLAGLVPLTGMLSGTLWSATADATRRYRAVLLLAIAGSWVATFFVSRATGLAGLLPLVLINAFFAAPIGPLIDSSVVAQLGDKRADYGRIRLWGSVGWGVSALLAGPVLERAGLSWAFTINLALLAVVFLISFRVPLAQTQAAPGSSFRGGLRVLLADGRYLTLLFTALVFGMSLSMVLSYLFLHMRAMGAGETLMAVTLTAATVSEVPFLFLAGRLLRRFGVSRVMAVALALMAARAFAYAWIAAPGWVVAINLFHGPTYALFWAAGVAESNRVAPPGLGATAQGAFAGAMFGLGSALGNLSGGIVYDQFGAPFLFRSVGWLLLATLVIFIGLRQRARQTALVAGQNN